MAGKNVFRTIDKSNLGWHFDLAKGEGAPYFADWLWAEGQMNDGYQYSAGFFTSPPPGIGFDGKLKVSLEKKCWPYTQLFIHAPNGKNYEYAESFPPGSLEPKDFGAVIGNNVFDGKINGKGLPESYTIKMSIGNIGLDVAARVVAGGVRFSDAEHGYSYYHPKRNIALGWWPLAVRSEVSGTIRFDGKSVSTQGLAYLERQCMNMPNAFGGGGQHMWYWGHFYGGEYTAVWTDSAATAERQHRHFTPFVLYKGKDVFFSTYNFACCTEKWGIDSTGKLYPAVISMRAFDGVREVNVQLWEGEIICIQKVENPVNPEKPGRYTRQYCDFNMQITHWGEAEEVSGKAIHEFGGGEYWDPFL